MLWDRNRNIMKYRFLFSFLRSSSQLLNKCFQPERVVQITPLACSFVWNLKNMPFALGIFRTCEDQYLLIFVSYIALHDLFREFHRLSYYKDLQRVQRSQGRNTTCTSYIQILYVLTGYWDSLVWCFFELPKACQSKTSPTQGL